MSTTTVKRSPFRKLINALLLGSVMLLGPRLNAEEGPTSCTTACIAVFGINHFHDGVLHWFKECYTVSTEGLLHYYCIYGDLE